MELHTLGVDGGYSENDVHEGGRRTVLVTDRRAKPDFVAFVQYLLNTVYTKARRVHLVMDNLNTHTAACQTAPHWLPRSTLGNSGAMQTSAVSRGRSLGRMQIRKWLNIMFRN